MSLALTTVSATNLCDSNGNPISAATIYFQPVTSDGVPTSFQFGGGGQVVSGPVSVEVSEGAFSIELADTSQTMPPNIGYAVSVLDDETGASLLGPGYECIQPTGPEWSFDTHPPNLAPNVTVQMGPAGPAGQGFNFRGQWLPEVQYAEYDVVYYAGSSYVLLGPLAPSTSFDPAAWDLLIGGALQSVVLVGVDDGLHYSITVSGGAVLVTQVDGNVPGGTSLPFIDVATGALMRLIVSGGNVVAISANSAMPSAAVYVDTSDGQHYALSEANGDLSVTPVSGTLAGVASTIFLDQATGQSYQFSLAGGTPALTLLSGNVAGVGYLYFVDPLTQRTYSLSVLSGNEVLTSL